MEEYTIPELEIILFDTADVITTSDAPETGPEDGTDWD